jgi:hypothetical protein
MQTDDLHLRHHAGLRVRGHNQSPRIQGRKLSAKFTAVLIACGLRSINLAW